MADKNKTSFFDKLQRIFQKGILLRGQDHVKIRNFDIEKVQSQLNLQTNTTDKAFASGFKKTGYDFDSLYLHGRQITRRELYADYEMMETDGRLSSALDIYADECLGPNTIIPLLNGEKKTIKELYNQDYKDFWVYSLDKKLEKFQPQKCEKVAYNGKKEMYKITLEDGTEIEATNNHLWVSNNDLIATKNLKIGDSLKVFATKLSNGKQMSGYEQLRENNKRQSKFMKKRMSQLSSEENKKIYSHPGKSNGMYKNGYKTFEELIDSNNHRIKNIEYLGIQDAYDLVNVSDSHIYAIETKDKGKLFCHNCTTKNEFGEILSIQTDDEDVKEALENLFYDVLNIEFNLWPWVRILCKYGDLFLKLDLTEKIGITNAYPLSNYAVRRVEENNDNIEFKYDPTLGLTNVSRSYKGETFQDYEMIHFRLLSDFNLIPYGKSILENARRTWKRIVLLEDAMLIQRIMRAPERRVVKVDVGNLPPNEVGAYMNQIINQMKKVPYMNEETGEFNLKFNLMNSLEDIFLPVRGDHSGTEIETLDGMEFTGMEDIEYEMGNLLASLKIPKSFLTYEEEMNARANLASEDIRFSRTIERIQRVVETELTKLALIHLFAQGFTDKQLTEFEIKLTTSSKLAEQERIEIWSDKLSLATDFMDSNLVPVSFIYEEILNISEDEYKEWINDDIPETLKLKFRYEQIQDEGNDPMKTKESSGTETDKDTWDESKKNKLEAETPEDKRKRLIKTTFENVIHKKEEHKEKIKEKIKTHRKSFIKKMKKTPLLSEKNILKEEDIKKLEK
jgi:hypothetical protein